MQHPRQATLQRQQPAPASRTQETGPQGWAAPQEAKQQESGQEKGREKVGDRDQQHRYGGRLRQDRPQPLCATAPTAGAILDTLAPRRNAVKQQILIVLSLAPAAFSSGCAKRDAHYRADDYQCGYTGSNEGHYSAFAGRQGRTGCGADYAAAAATQLSGRETR